MNRVILLSAIVSCVLLPSCRLQNQRVDFSWVKDTMSAPQDDSVYVETPTRVQELDELTKGRHFSKPTMVVYKVRKGDNLSDIAKHCNTTVAQIRKDSGIKGDKISPGQTIKVLYTPKGYKPAAKRDKASRTSAKFNKPTLVVYRVRMGDNLSDIAKRSNTTVAQIRRDSGIKGDKISPGQIIKVRYTPRDSRPGKKNAN